MTVDINWLTTNRGRRTALAGLAGLWLIIIAAGALVGHAVGGSTLSAWLGALIACGFGTAAFGVLTAILLRRRRDGRI